MLTLRLLGPIEIRFGDRAIDAAGRDKGLTLLAFLAATAGRHYAREDLADLFWPGMSRERGLHNLRQTLLRLRGLLTASGAGPAGLLTRRSTVALDRHMDYWLDLQAFAVPIEDNATLESLERRAALYRGPFMADLAGDIGERFEQWVADRRAEYQVTALALESKLAAHYERDGRLERAIVHAQRCVALEPWNESGQRLQLRLLALSGHPEAALSHFRALRESLRRELGAEVEAATLALAESIRRGSLVPAEAVNVPAPVERRQVTVLDCGLACGDEDDPEALAAILAEPCRLARTIIERQGGAVAEQRPGRVTAFFGWPTADERAVSQAA